MEYLTGSKNKETTELPELLEESSDQKTVTVTGMIHTIRSMGEITFLILRKRDGLLQCIFEKDAHLKKKDLKEGMAVKINGVTKIEPKAPNGLEIKITTVEILSKPEQSLPLPISNWNMKVSLEAKQKYRAIALRNIKERSKFRIQEAITRGFRDYLYQNGFTEIHTPKIGEKGAEGGSNIFQLEYFHRPAVLAQSPQLYKQMMVGVFERVFETGPVFRAEKHNTKRHLNEYTSLDFEMGFIEDFTEIMEMETGFLKYTMELLKNEYKKELKILNISLPNFDKIPTIKFEDAKQLIAEEYGHIIKNPFDLEPEEEVQISRYFKEKFDSDFVFVTHYPSKKRPFYTMDDSNDPTYTMSFDLLFRGIEITTGGQRIHEYQKLIEKMKKKKISEDGLTDYLKTFAWGMPPHGGLGIGLERFAMKLVEEDNIRETTLFPRDMSRLQP